MLQSQLRPSYRLTTKNRRLVHKRQELQVRRRPRRLLHLAVRTWLLGERQLCAPMAPFLTRYCHRPDDARHSQQVSRFDPGAILK